MKGYGQYCPLALAAELLCNRWTLLVISRLLDGCTRYNDIHRGLPQISPSLLSSRLSELHDAGILTRTTVAGKRGGEYLLTEAGRALAPMVDQLAVWGQQWARDMVYEDLDPAFLLWSMHLRTDPKVMPAGRTVIEFTFTDSPTQCRRFWLVCEREQVEMCLRDPGFEPNVTVSADLRRFVEAWRGFRNLRDAIDSGRILIQGPERLVRRMPDFLLGSALAPYPRRRSGHERQLAQKLDRHPSPGTTLTP